MEAGKLLVINCDHILAECFGCKAQSIDVFVLGSRGHNTILLISSLSRPAYNLNMVNYIKVI